MAKRTLEWLEKQMEKDRVEIENHKKQMIEEIKKMDKVKLFKKDKKKKLTFIKKLLIILGHGKKR